MVRKSFKAQKGRGFATDLLKKLLMEGAPLVANLLKEPANELGAFIGKKVKSLTGEGARLAGEDKQNGGMISLAGQKKRVYQKRMLSPLTD